MPVSNAREVEQYLKHFSFAEPGNLSLFPAGEKATCVDKLQVGGETVTRYVNEFWTSKQRNAASIQEISYRACFKPQLPRFFIELFTSGGDVVYDPFSGRGTSAVEAALLGRQVISNDINPLSFVFAKPRIDIPALKEVESRLREIKIKDEAKAALDLSMFFHPQTEAEIVSLQQYLYERRISGAEDAVDLWIRMVATNRLTGHSPGFFSVYTLPPNQAASQKRQLKINAKRKQEPEYRDTKALILKKSQRLLNRLNSRERSNLKGAAPAALFLEKDAAGTGEIAADSVQLTVTSPPFLDVVQYAQDNWMRCWFNSIDMQAVERKLTMAKNIQSWSAVMQKVFFELYRVTRSGGWVAFEVGEVKNKTINLDEYVVPLGIKAGFHCAGIIINQQKFTKTSNIWGVNNNSTGTNTNRIVLFLKP